MPSIRGRGFWGCAAGALALARAALGQCAATVIDPPTVWAYGDFGYSIAVAPGELIVGDFGDDSLCPSYASCNSGVVYVFELMSGAWRLRQRVTSADLAEQDQFGIALAVLENTLLVGASSDSSAGLHGGAAYIFTRQVDGWSESGQLLPPVWERSSSFGLAVALLTDWAFISQPKLNAPGMGDVGAVQVYRREGADWRFAQALTPPDPALGMHFGRAVAVDGDTLVVGAPDDGERVRYGGSAYIFRLDGSDWRLEQKLRTTEVQIGMSAGYSVAIEGDSVAIGAPIYETDPALGGAVFIFERDAGAWKQTAVLTHADQVSGDWLGAAVVLSDGALFAGAPHTGPVGGAAYIFKRDGAGAWRQTTKLEPPPGLGRSFAEAMAVGGGVVAIGDPWDAVAGLPSVGRAFTFDLPCALCRVDLDGDGALTLFDFLTFFNLFAAGDLGADFDGDGELTLFDFLAFQDEFGAGC